MSNWIYSCFALPKHVYSDLQYPSPHEAWQQFIFWEKNICCQHATRRTTNEIWIMIMIIAWWYSNKFLSLPIILSPFYSILFTCLLVSPYGDYLPAGDSVSFISFYLLVFRCLHAVIICLLDMDRMRCDDYLPAEYGSHKCFGPDG